MTALEPSGGFFQLENTLSRAMFQGLMHVLRRGTSYRQGGQEQSPPFRLLSICRT